MKKNIEMDERVKLKAECQDCKLYSLGRCKGRTYSNKGNPCVIKVGNWRIV